MKRTLCMQSGRCRGEKQNGEGWADLLRIGQAGHIVSVRQQVLPTV